MKRTSWEGDHSLFVMWCLACYKLLLFTLFSIYNPSILYDAYMIMARGKKRCQKMISPVVNYREGRMGRCLGPQTPREPMGDAKNLGHVSALHKSNFWLCSSVDLCLGR